MLLAASGGGNGGDGTTMDVCDAILLQYADIVDVRSSNDGNCTLAFDGGNIDGELPTLTMACGVCVGESNDGGERAATRAAAVAAVAAGRGGAEALAGGSNV